MPNLNDVPAMNVAIRICEEFAEQWEMQARSGDNTGASDHRADAARQIIAELRNVNAAPSAVALDDERVAFERALFELVNKIDTGLDSGDLLTDARRASAAIDSILSGGDLVACAHEYFRDSGDRYEKSIEFRTGWNACLDAIGKACAASPQATTVPADCDVRKILLRVVPGDGSGHEVYAKNVADVEVLLSEMGERLEDFELTRDAAMGVPQPEAGVSEERGLTDAARDMLTERQRQVSTEGWTSDHDDEHEIGELARAAACYAANATGFRLQGRVNLWPWDREWWKPTTPRRDLVKAGALIIAEIERIDRRAAVQPATGGDRG